MSSFTFHITDAENQKASYWMKEHSREAEHKYIGSIGGTYSWVFTPTGIGTVIKVECSCGAELDLTDYNNW